MATDETQTRIIQAAGPIFAEKGYRDATVREICEAANVGSASINYHFRDKQHLYVLVVERAYEEMQCSHPPRLDDVPEMPDPERLAEWILRLTRKSCATAVNHGRIGSSAGSSSNRRLPARISCDSAYRQI